MIKINISDLTKATVQAAKLSIAVGQPPVVAGALAMAAHGYCRETSDVDIVIPVIIGTPSGDAVENAACLLGLTVRAKHGFGGLDLRDGEVRIDVLTLDREIPGLVADAVQEAIASRRTMELFGQQVYVVSLGHLIAMKIVAERKKDIGDIVELIKIRIENGQWNDDQESVISVVQKHIGWYSVRIINNMVKAAREELGMI